MFVIPDMSVSFICICKDPQLIQKPKEIIFELITVLPFEFASEIENLQYLFTGLN